MAVEKVQLGVSAIKELLDNGYTWLKRDDLGFGSIQEKYQASDVQIATIRKHPALKDLETTARVFVIIDDTKSIKPIANGTTATLPADNGGSESLLESVSKSVRDEAGDTADPFEATDNQEANVSTVSSDPATVSDEDSFSAFANL